MRVGFRQLRTCRRTRPGQLCAAGEHDLRRAAKDMTASSYAFITISRFRRKLWRFLQIGIREFAARALTGSHISYEMTTFHQKWVWRGTDERT